MDKRIVFPTSLQCGPAKQTGVLESNVSKSPWVGAMNAQTVGVRDGLCGEVVSRVVVSAHYTILVRKQTALITDDRATVVVTDQMRFSRTQKSMDKKEKANEIELCFAGSVYQGRRRI